MRQVLGHRNVQTTISAYIGLENIRASEIFSKIVMDHMDEIGGGGVTNWSQFLGRQVRA